MAKIGSLQKMMTSLDIFVEEKSSPNNLRNLPLKGSAVVLGHPVYLFLFSRWKRCLDSELKFVAGSYVNFATFVCIYTCTLTLCLRPIDATTCDVFEISPPPKKTVLASDRAYFRLLEREEDKTTRRR